MARQQWQPRTCTCSLWTATRHCTATGLCSSLHSLTPTACPSPPDSSSGLCAACEMWVSCVDVMGSLPCCLWDVGCGSLVLMSWGLYIVAYWMWSLVLMSWGLYLAVCMMSWVSCVDVMSLHLAVCVMSWGLLC